MYKSVSLLFLFFCFLSFSCNQVPDKNSTVQQRESLNYNLHIFYYNWYGNPQFDSVYRHWAHDVLKKFPRDTLTGHFPGRDNIGANYYPLLETYSCNDSSIIRKHMEMISRAGVGVIILTWWGKGSFEDKNVKRIMDMAQRFKIKVGFHIEPFPDRNTETVIDALKYIINCYGNHPAFYRLKEFDNRSLFYVYDSYLIKADEWATILTRNGISSIRGTKYDAVMIGLWVNEKEEDFFMKSGFDGYYTYFANCGFTFGSTPENWSKMQNWARSNNKLFIPCVGPGYIDTRIRPWNAINSRDREGGEYYDKMFESAIQSGTSMIGITSFNEWHEGTQIEPSVPRKIKDFTYNDFQPLSPWYYIDRTRCWSEKYKSERFLK